MRTSIWSASTRCFNQLLRIICLVLIFSQFITTTPASAYTNSELIDGFEKTVFGSEYSSLFARPYVRKFVGPVRFYVDARGNQQALEKVQSFVASLRRHVRGLKVQLVRSERNANFVVHVVPRSRYAVTVRQKVYRRADAPVVGRCMVRAIYSEEGISHSDAVIVSDEGDALFNRCMTEEILQGLGPLNDNPDLSASMFNDTSRFTSFRRFDRFILNMLYDPAVKVGATPRQVAPLLPAVLRRARTFIEG